MIHCRITKTVRWNFKPSKQILSLLSANLKENLSEVMKLRNELLKATIFKDNHVVNYSFDEKDYESANSSPRKTTVNFTKDMDSVLEASSK